MTPSLTPLSCAACGAAVPLVEGEHTPCPHCGTRVEIPAEHRELRRRELEQASQRDEGTVLARELARAPSFVVRWMSMFDAPAFLLLGLGVWITAGVIVGVLLPPRIGELFGVRSYDVLDVRTEMLLAVGLPLGTFALGLLGGGWARKRAIVRGGLQAALAAEAPERPGGPARCRQCGAALEVHPADLHVRCPYCRSDNLVHLPPAWLARMRAHAGALGREVAAARDAWHEQRRALRSSLVGRAIVGALVVGVPLLIIAGTVVPGNVVVDEDAGGPPGELPSWHDVRARHPLLPGFCTPATLRFVGVMTRAEDCDADGCGAYRRVPLARGERIRVHAAAPPEGTEVALQIHERRMLDDVWVTVARAPLRGEVVAVFEAPLSAWYRVAYRFPGARAGEIERVCVER